MDRISFADLRRITGLPPYVINHALNVHGPAPVDRVGICRLWGREQLPQIEESLRKTAAKSTLPQRRQSLEGGLP
jgi:hypothetical protein